MRFYKISRTYSWVYSGHNCTCISNKASVIPLPRDILFFDVLLAELKQRPLVKWRKLDDSIVVAAPIKSMAINLLLVSGLTPDILSTFYGVLMIQCVKIMLRIFEFGVLLFDCFVYHQNVTGLKRFTRYGHYAGEAEDIIIGKLSL